LPSLAQYLIYENNFWYTEEHFIVKPNQCDPHVALLVS
jgi:hypothetical protein